MPNNNSLSAEDQAIEMSTIDPQDANDLERQSNSASNLEMRKFPIVGVCFTTFSIAGMALVIAGAVTENIPMGLLGVGILVAMICNTGYLNRTSPPTGNLDTPTVTAATETSVSRV